MLKTEGLEEKQMRKYETYKNTVTPHGQHIYAQGSDISKATMCVYPQSYNALPHCKCVMRCCAKFHVLIFLAKKNMINIQTLVLQFNLTFII